VCTASIISALMMEAVGISQTSVYFNKTGRRYIPKNCNLHASRRENLKYHKILNGLKKVSKYGPVMATEPDESGEELTNYI
jgi:hypothetical protein